MKLCSKCGNEGEFCKDKNRRDGLSLWCRVCSRAAYQAYVAANPGIESTRLRRMYSENAEFRARTNKRNQSNDHKIREAVFAHYGKQCACCGETHWEFLTIDHVHGDGAAHRRQIGRARLYRWLRKNRFPEGFRTLCMNCNFAVGRVGYCPHGKL